MSPRERLLAMYREPSRPPFPDAVPVVCDAGDGCGAFIIWTNPPDPGVPTRCAQCAVEAR